MKCEENRQCQIHVTTLCLRSRKRSHYSLKVEAEAYTENAYNFLLTIPPASIEPERTFSSASIHCSNLSYEQGCTGQHAVLAKNK